MTELIQTYGALGVFLLISGPRERLHRRTSEVTLLFSGVAVSAGWMSFPLAVLAATAGNLVEVAVFAYGLGASRLLAGVPGAGVVLERWEGLFERHGTRAVFIARLLPLAPHLRLAAGARRVPLVAFVALTIVGCALWATAFVLAGMLAGTAWAAISSVLGKVLLGVGVVVLVLSVSRVRQRHD